MQLLVDYFPLVLFFVAFKWQGIYVATGVAIVASILQIAWLYWRRGKVAIINWLSLAIIAVFGALRWCCRMTYSFAGSRRSSMACSAPRWPWASSRFSVIFWPTS
jgi:hypothetical protein